MHVVHAVELEQSSQEGMARLQDSQAFKELRKKSESHCRQVALSTHLLQAAIEPLQPRHSEPC